MGKNLSFKRLNISEIVLIQLILYTGTYLWNPHIGFLLCLTFMVISFFILIISYILELIERSKVPSWYYRLMWVSILCPLVILIFFTSINGLEFLTDL